MDQRSAACENCENRGLFLFFSSSQQVFAIYFASKIRKLNLKNQNTTFVAVFLLNL